MLSHESMAGLHCFWQTAGAQVMAPNGPPGRRRGCGRGICVRQVAAWCWILLPTTLPAAPPWTIGGFGWHAQTEAWICSEIPPVAALSGVLD